MPHSLSNVAFNIPDSVASGYQAQDRAVRDAALKGADELSRVTRLDWEEV